MLDKKNGQIMGSHLTVAVDVYAFGSILWELLTVRIFDRKYSYLSTDSLNTSYLAIW
jgi:hypothetical protein